MEQLDTILITQARVNSTRLPGKVLLKVNDHELLKIHVSRIQKSKYIEKIIIATTDNQDDNKISDFCKNNSIDCFRGSEDDVLDRFYKCSTKFKPNYVVRVTSDCPLIDPEIIDAVVLTAKINDLDYCSNILVESFPDGQDVEVFKYDALEYAWSNAVLKSEREHVTPYIKKNIISEGGNLFRGINFKSATDYSNIRMTVDEVEDFIVVENLILNLGTDVSWRKYTDYILKNKLFEINNKQIRNSGYLKSIKND